MASASVSFWYKNAVLINMVRVDSFLIPAEGDEVFLDLPTPQLYKVEQRKFVKRGGSFTVDIYLGNP